MSSDGDTKTGGGGLGLGGRLPLLSPERMTDRQRALYATLAPAKRAEASKGGYVAQAPDGALIGPFNAYFYQPEMAEGYMAWIEAQHDHLPFAPEVRETIILTIGAIWQAPFELYAHRAVARTAGLPPPRRSKCLRAAAGRRIYRGRR